jgi:hypothetical protein
MKIKKAGTVRDLRRWRRYERTKDYVFGYFRGCAVNVWFDENDRLYAIVTDQDGYTLCDGWAPEDVFTLDDAVAWALKGSLLEGGS